MYTWRLLVDEQKQRVLESLTEGKRSRESLFVHSSSHIPSVYARLMKTTVKREKERTSLEFLFTNKKNQQERAKFDEYPRRGGVRTPPSSPSSRCRLLLLKSQPGKRRERRNEKRKAHYLAICLSISSPLQRVEKSEKYISSSQSIDRLWIVSISGLPASTERNQSSP